MRTSQLKPASAKIERPAEVVRRGIVASISVGSVQRYLAESELQPHRSKYWLNTTEKDPALFEQQVQVVFRGLNITVRF